MKCVAHLHFIESELMSHIREVGSAAGADSMGWRQPFWPARRSRPPRRISSLHVDRIESEFRDKLLNLSLPHL